MSKGRNSIHLLQEIYLPQIQVFSTGWSETAMDSIRFFAFHSGFIFQNVVKNRNQSLYLIPVFWRKYNRDCNK